MLPDLKLQHYILVRELGKGGMARVFLAEHRFLHNQVAIKFLHEHLARDPQIRARFISEAQKMAQMDHPGVVKVYDLIDDGTHIAFVMEYVQGTTLANRIKTGPRLQNHDILNIMSGLLQALSYVHRFPLIHRDIKPENIFITETGTVKLGDFGISKDLAPDAPNLTTTQSGIMGTLRYMSPEQFDHRKSITYKTDLYSAGVVLWEMVTGKKAYDYLPLEIPYHILNEPLPSTGNETWDDIIRQATHKHIGERFNGANSFLETMQEAFENAPDYVTKKHAIRPSKNEKQNMDIGFYLMVGSALILFFYAIGWENSKNQTDDSGPGYVTIDSTAAAQGDSKGDENNEENPVTVGEVNVNPPRGTRTGTPPVNAYPKKLQAEIDELNIKIERYNADITIFEKQKKTANQGEEKKIDEEIKGKQTYINLWKKQKTAKEAELRKLKESVEAPPEIFTVVDEMPSFPGGESALVKYLSDNIKYPLIAKFFGITGTVYITFQVGKDGKVAEAKVLRGIGGGCEEEAVRVVKSMPSWRAGKHRGQAVIVQYNIPIRFSLK